MVIAYRSDGDGGQCKGITDDVSHVDALAAVGAPRVFHFPERRGVKRAVGGHKDKAVADQVLTTAGGLWNESAALGSETTIENQ